MGAGERVLEVPDDHSEKVGAFLTRSLHHHRSRMGFRPTHLVLANLLKCYLSYVLSTIIIHRGPEEQILMPNLLLIFHGLHTASVLAPTGGP